MSVLIIGGDSINPISLELKKYGFDEVLHWDCRKKSVVHRSIPQRVDYVLMLTSFLSHSVMKKIKGNAKSAGIPTLFAKRNRIDVTRCLECGICSK